MPGRKKKTSEKLPVFDSIRKPTAPPSRKFNDAKAETKIQPAGRKDKHKRKPDAEDS
jgi:hypothetical protein